MDTRTVHPFASKHYQRPLHPDLKTDDNDLAAIFHAAINGRAGLSPSRYQRDAVDYQGGLSRSCNRRLRGAAIDGCQELDQVPRVLSRPVRVVDETERRSARSSLPDRQSCDALKS